ncbi:hypothetical protein F5I97DRAFT_1880096 [Phlebopus sp. FC_14]|nr:hypothetical protein F5I97DRAFT_1880096 [Phlebopus sp. FC_14]
MNWQVAAYYCFLLPLVTAQYTPTSRWGQAAAVLEDTLYVHGGMTDPYNTYSYTSAPEISDILSLNLSVSFSSASPPWQLLSADSSPALAWHTLSATFASS